MESHIPILSISTVKEFVYCPRNTWYAFVGERRNLSNSIHFIKAIHAHKAVDEISKRIRTDCTQITGMYLYSNRLGLTGRADLVEWRNGFPIPVETKNGFVRDSDKFELQIALQALCLEEMFSVSVPSGEIFFSESKRRKEVAIDKKLREQSLSVITEVRESLLSFDINRFQRVNDNRCPTCQYRESCLPPVLEL